MTTFSMWWNNDFNIIRTCNKQFKKKIFDEKSEIQYVYFVDKMSMEYVRNRDDMVVKESELKVSMGQMYNRMQQEVHWLPLVQNEDQRFF
jgi:hypothetical protein